MTSFNKVSVYLYAATLILSAFLLFSVQPMFAKMILPLLGGSPSVWNIAMVFFQAMLLGGYAYAHLSSRYLSLQVQAILHVILLGVCMTLLPFSLPANVHPSGNPSLWQIWLMASVVGAPFFVLSASAPMIQHWFSATGHKDAGNPYFLYAASNIGSMVALLSYPTIAEPWLTVKMQTLAWAGGYGVLIAMIAFCALAVWNKKIERSASMAAPKISGITKIVWMILALIPSSLMLGVTTYITTDLAAIPLLWIVPLTLYLLTFILVFARKPIVTMDYTVSLFTAFFGLLLLMLSAEFLNKNLFMLFMHLVVFFFAALLCHKKLADMRPAAHDLTAFYMYMSLGGVLGGIFNALLAPLLFVVPLEYTFVLCAVLFVRGYCFLPDKMHINIPSIENLLRSPRFWFFVCALCGTFLAWYRGDIGYYILSGALTLVALMSLRSRPMAFAAVGTLFLLIHSPVTLMRDSTILELRRNFFGVLQVSEDDGLRNFLHGTTLHGAQPLDPKYRMTQMTYYNPQGPVGDIFKVLDGRTGPQKIAAIGLGTGTIACYKHKGRSFDFYEIDSDVVKIAEDKNYFTYLSNCGSPYTIKLGDGRLTLDQVPDGTYDALILDAFSSDNIPMHLLTLDAFRVYMRKVKAGGMIVINISNRYLDLEPQLGALSMETRVPAVMRYSISKKIAEDTDLTYAASLWVVFSPNPATFMPLRYTGKWFPVRRKEGHPVWTDDYANIISSLRIWDQ